MSNPCTTMSMVVFTLAQRRLELLVLTHRPRAVRPPSRLSAHLLLVVASATAVAITQLERVPLALTQEWCALTVLTRSLLSLQKTQYVTAIRTTCFIVYTHLYIIKRFAYCRYPLRIRSYSRDFDSACWHSRAIHGARQQAPEGRDSLEAHNLSFRDCHPHW